MTGPTRDVFQLELEKRGVVQAVTNEVTGVVRKYAGGVAVQDLLDDVIAADAPSLISVHDVVDNVDTATWGAVTLPNPYAAQANAPVHPSMLVFPNGWQGYRYWVAYTPYPGYDSQYENPCVAASNDLEAWVEPTANPLVAKPSGTAYNADTRLFMSPDGTTMYLAFREREVASKNHVKIMHTTDGKTWSAPVAVLTGDHGTLDFASPSIWHDGSQWVMVSHQLDSASPWPIQRRTASDPYGTWSAPTTVSIAPASGRAWWHSDVQRLSSGQVVALLQDNVGSAGGSGDLYIAVSGDGGATFGPARKLFTTGGKYKATFAPVRTADGDRLYCLISDFPTLTIKFVDLGFGEIEAANALLSRVNSLIASAADPLGAYVVDTFQRADSTASLGTATSGTAWAASSGTWGIRSNTAYPVASGRVLMEAGVTEYFAHVQFYGIESGVQQWFIVRAVDGSNCWRFGVTAPTAADEQTLAVQSIVAGSFGAYNTAIGKIRRGDLVSVRVEHSMMVVYVNGREIWRVMDGTHAAGTKCGLQANSGGASTAFKRFAIEKI